MNLGKIFFLVSFAALATGCATHSISQWGVRPSAANGYVGKVSGEPFADLYNDMRMECANFGGLNSASVKDIKVGRELFPFLETAKEFRCNGPIVTSTGQAGASTQSKNEIEKLRSEANATRIRQQELEEKLRQVQQQPISSVQSVAPQITDRLSLDASKVKCGELGFKSGTEAFGKCVLQLSK